MDDIHANVAEINKRFVTDGLQALAISLKTKSSSGIQGQEPPPDWLATPYHEPDYINPNHDWGTPWLDDYQQSWDNYHNPQAQTMYEDPYHHSAVY